MHPIVSRPRQLGLYALAWVPLTALLVYLFRAAGLKGAEAGILLWLLAPLFALMCLLAWYPCRATPVQTSGIIRIIATHSAGAALISGAWMLFAMLYVSVLSLLDSFQGLAAPKGLYKLIFGVGVLLYMLSVAFHYVLFSMESERQSEQHVYEARVLARDAELRALKSQINPHFIFNSLHSISALTSIDPSKAREMCISLADFLRITLGMGEKKLIPLSDELELVHRYLAVEKVRFGSRLQMEEQVEAEALTCIIPPLLLQPLVENAIVHGIAHLPQGGWIRLEVRSQANRLIILVENNLDPDLRPAKRHNGIGLANVRERVDTRYGKASSFAAKCEGDTFRVAISLPVERSAAT